MSQSFFSKLDPKEKESRLAQLAGTKGELTIWIKGQPLKQVVVASDFDKEKLQIILDSKDLTFIDGSILLCNFNLRGVSFFSQVVFQKELLKNGILIFNSELFKSERRASFRLLTFPIYKVFAEFDLNEKIKEENVVSLNTKTGQTALFKKFLNLVENTKESYSSETLKLRVQDLSTTGMGIYVGDLEARFFTKDTSFKNVRIKFEDEVITIPDVTVVYNVNLVSQDRNSKKYKIGLHFNNLPSYIDDLLGGKINKLLRETDSNKDFENFLK